MAQTNTIFKTYWVQHSMDEQKREMTLDEAFLEALQLSDPSTSEIEQQEHDLLLYLEKHPESILHLTETYKKKVLEGWEYTVTEKEESSQ